MSATNRGGERQPDDLYITQDWPVQALLARLALPGGRWLEPGAGDGAIVRSVQTLRSDVQFLAVEKHDTLAGQVTPCDWWIGDFLDPSVELLAALSGSGGVDAGFDVTIGNPPYKFAQEFIEQSIRFSAIVCFLLRLDFLGSKGRTDFYRRYPADVYVLHDRPSFILSIKCKICNWRTTLPLAAKRPSQCETPNCDGKLQFSTNDANEYGWFVWGLGGGKLIHLDPREKIGPSLGYVDLIHCQDCGKFLTHGHVCEYRRFLATISFRTNGNHESCDLTFHTLPCSFHKISQADLDAARTIVDEPMKTIIDVNENETEAAAKKRQETTDTQAARDAGLEPGAFYALADGRLAKFDGISLRFSFFDCTRNSTTSKIRLETANVQAWPTSRDGAVECSDCGWLIAGEAAAGAESCPYCASVSTK